jgi:hypothetical protein
LVSPTFLLTNFGFSISGASLTKSSLYLFPVSPSRYVFTGALTLEFSSAALVKRPPGVP